MPFLSCPRGDLKDIEQIIYWNIIHEYKKEHHYRLLNTTTAFLNTFNARECEIYANETKL